MNLDQISVLFYICILYHGVLQQLMIIKSGTLCTLHIATKIEW